MLEWSKKFDTNVEFIDKQHQQIFMLLNQLRACCTENTANPYIISTALSKLNAYSRKHFQVEEALMASQNLDERHVRIHRMEHFSFIHDIENMWAHDNTQDSLLETSEKLVAFITRWWCYHILGMDQLMSVQLEQIKLGLSPASAYDMAPAVKYDTELTHFMIDSVLHLWQSATKRCHELETQLASLNTAGNGSCQ